MLLLQLHCFYFLLFFTVFNNVFLCIFVAMLSLYNNNTLWSICAVCSSSPPWPREVPVIIPLPCTGESFAHLTGLHTRAVSYMASAHARSSDKRMRTWLRLYCQVCCEEHTYIHQLAAAAAFCAFQWYTNPCYLQSMALFFLFPFICSPPRHVHERVCYKVANCDVTL